MLRIGNCYNIQQIITSTSTMTKSTSHIWTFLAIFWFGVSVYGLFLQTPNGQPPQFIHIDKVAHWGMFLVQFYLLGRIMYAKNKTINYGRLLLLALFWATSSELIQGYFTTRTMDKWDAAADMFGVICALGLLHLRVKVPNINA